MNSDNFFKPRLSKLNHFPIKCQHCYLRSTIVISYNQEENSYYPKNVSCKVCSNPITISVTPVAVRKK